MKVLLTGADGQLGQALQQYLTGHDVMATDQNSLDITDRSSVQALVSQYNPDVLINTAAYTQVDAAESDIDRAYLVNETGPLYLSQATSETGAAIVHVSTDYVFDGKSKKGWLESDETLAAIDVRLADRARLAASSNARQLLETDEEVNGDAEEVAEIDSDDEDDEI